jgi:RHS repeat-associated protein
MKNFYYTLLFLGFSICSIAQTAPTGGSPEVGITEGQLSVSLTGGATYSVPIAVPPGINGVVPQVSLVYNSQGGNGMAGYGWNISGVSAITRIPRTKFHDGVVGGVNLDANDRFAFDGQRLILKSGIYGENGSVYETENFSNVKITLAYANIGTPNHPDSYFIVEYPDGSKGIYGKSVDSRTGIAWGITYWENPQGVRISYNYYNSDYKMSIKTIDYGSVQTGTAINQIKFVYKTRVRPEQAYVGGLSIVNNTILSGINVIGKGGVGYRNYILDYNSTSLGYQRLKKITESSGDGTKSLNPTVFGYEDTPVSIASNPKKGILNYPENFSSDEDFVGDFNDDGKIDLIGYNSITGNIPDGKRYFLSGISGNGDIQAKPLTILSDANDIFPITMLSKDNKIASYKGLLQISATDDSKVYTLNVYSLRNNIEILEYQKKIDFTSMTANDGNYVSVYYRGDFNGDGLTDILIKRDNTNDNEDSEWFFVDLDRNKNSNFFYSLGKFQTNFSTGDFNGDGKLDLFALSNSTVQVFSIDEITHQFKELTTLYQFSNCTSSSDSNLLGDFNGDHKMDFVHFRYYCGEPEYSIFLSTGSSFVKHVFPYRQPNEGNKYFSICYDRKVLDINNDGKSDILEIQNPCSSISPYIPSIIGYISTGDSMIKTELGNVEMSHHSPFISYKNNDDKSTLEIISLGRVANSFKFLKNEKKDVLLKSITNGNGVKESISYSALNCSDQPGVVYTATKGTEFYPNKDLIFINDFPLVSEIVKQSATVNKRQQFSYYGAVSNVEGLGFLGFRASMRTNWFEKEEQIISSISKFDPNLRGANVENYTYLGLAALPSAVNTAAPNAPRVNRITVNNTRTATETILATNSITFLPGATITPTAGNTFLAKITPDFDTNGYAETNTSPQTGLISKSLSFYETSLSLRKVFKLQNIQSNNYNILDNTSNQSNTVYDGYNYPTQNTTLLKEGGVTVQTTESNVGYEPVSTSPFVAGRPNSKTQSITAYGDTMTSGESYFYKNNLLWKIEKKGHNTPEKIVEENEYDLYANITQKTITAGTLAARVTHYEYDPSGRFLIKSKDIGGLETIYDYDWSSGFLKSETNPYKLTTTYTPDSWFKKIKTTDYLGKITNHEYYKIYEKTTINTIGDDESGSGVIFDDLDRKIQSRVKDINGNYSNVFTQYDIYDRVIKVSEPSYGSPTQWNETEYDVYGRPKYSKDFTGKTVTIKYEGLTTTVDDNVKVKVSRKNAMGNIVSLTEKLGGTINYTYFANGNLKSSNYDKVVTTIEQDGWGRKTKLTDPSAGIYSYAYNGFGETTTETTPNGTTTYTLDDFGKLKTKTISGTNTNSVSDYVYDSSSKLLLSSTFKDTKEASQTNYTYTYDSSKRITTTVEETPFYGTKFTKLVSYDAFGRIEYETSTAALGVKSSAKKIKNVYKNGSPWQIIDDATQQVLWQTNEVNARGQLTKANLGKGIAITNGYDQFGFAHEFKHDKTGGTPVNVMTLTTNFDEKKGNLKDRTNSLFTNGLEVFEYDALDRLTKYPNALGEQVVQDYDARGRITKNNIGTYNYDTAKPYQNKEILLTPEAHGYYADREGIFNDSMEEQKDWQKPDTAVFFDKTIAHTGGTSFKISNANTTEKYAHSNLWIPISNSVETEYTYSAWVYTDNPQAELFLFMKTPTETGYFSLVHSVTTSVKNQWVLLEGKFKVPTSITKLNIRLDNNGQGNVWFDDVQIRKTSNTATTLRNLNIDYNVYKSPVRIEETGVDIINFAYNDSNSRSAMFYGSLDVLPKDRPYRKFYSADGTMEIKENRVTGVMDFVTYIGGDGYTAPIVLKSDGINQNYLYLHRDYQGSILAITNASGAVVEKRLFDAWGSIIKVQDGAGNTINGFTILDRGYTGHEHLQSVGLIHMNGRLYDPKLHKFLQPDNNIQDPLNTQNYNRYGYCLNNPTTYIDPTGESYDDDDPELGWDYEDGVEWIDKFGRWIYNKELQTWMGKDGSADIFNAIALNEVIIGGRNFSNASNGFYGSGLSAYSTDNTWGMSGYDVGGNYSNRGSLAGFDVSGFKADFGNYSGEGFIDLRSKVSGIEANGNVTYGNKIFSQSISASGAIFSAEANINGSSLTGKDSRYGIRAGFDLGAYAAKGEVTGGVEIFGAKVESSVGGSFASAHAGGQIDVHWNSNTGVLSFSGLEHVGFGIGALAGVKGGIPLRAWYDFFLK